MTSGGSGEPFAWMLDESLWPPQKMPRAPLSMTSVEVARSCPLLTCQPGGNWGVQVQNTAPASRK